MTDIVELVADNLQVWTGAIERKSAAGRGSGKRFSLYGIERLRALILDLAVRGKLVPQDTADEPASELLKTIKDEKSRLVASGKAKQGKPLVAPSEWPFEVPDTWSWSQLGHVTNYGQTEKVDPGSVSPETWVLELENVEKSSSHLLERVRYANKPFQSQKNAFQIGDVIYGKLRPYLDKVIIADEPGVCTTEMVPMRGYAGLRPDYIRLFLKSPFFITLATEAAHGMNLPRLATEKAREAPIALPPLAEQQRIVAKVDQLMALCDALERESAAAMAAHQALVEALLATLVNSVDAADLARHWTRLESHFDTLFTTDASIEALKQTILDIAVRAKLVEQNVGDGTADQFLRDVKIEKANLVREGKIKKEKAPTPVKQADKPFELPASWAWSQPEEFSLKITDGEHFRPPTVTDGVYFLSAKDVREDGVSLADPLFISPETAAKARSRCNPEFGDLLIVSRGATCGRICRVNIHDEFCLLGSVILLKPSAHVESRYLEAALKSSGISSALISASGATAQGAIYLRDLKKIAIPIPPLAEQRRIVAKVDALMALCDALKTRLADAAKTQRHLAGAITERAAA